MILKKTLLILLSLILTATPISLSAQSRPKFNSQKYGFSDFNQFKSENSSKLEKFTLKATSKKSHIALAWQEYNAAVKDYKRSVYHNYTPYQIMETMEKESEAIGELLKKSPRYVKAENEKYKTMILTGLLLIPITLISAPIASTAGSAVAACGAGTVIKTATVISADIFITEKLFNFGTKQIDALYEDLSNCLINYGYSLKLSESVSKGWAITDKSIVKEPPSKLKSLPIRETSFIIQSQENDGNIIQNTIIPADNTRVEKISLRKAYYNYEMIKVLPETLWFDEFAQAEAIIRLHGLSVIKNELKYGISPSKYDMALLDLISLFSDKQQVHFDEDVFTRAIISEGEISYQKDTNIVDIRNPGRLVKRTPDLIKALNAIQPVPADLVNPSRPIHPREVNGIIWPTK